MATLSNSVATCIAISLAHVQVWDTEKQREHRCEADQEWKHQKQVAIQDAYAAVEPIQNGCQKSIWMPAGFSDTKYQTC